MSNTDPYNSSKTEARAENGPTQPAIETANEQTINESEAAANYNGSLLDADKVEAPFEGDKLNETEVAAGIDGSTPSHIDVVDISETFGDEAVANDSEVKAGLTDEPAEAKTDSTVDKGGDVPEGTIDEVLEWVGDDSEKAKLALDAEVAGQNRKSLVSKLKAI